MLGGQSLRDTRTNPANGPQSAGVGLVDDDIVLLLQHHRDGRQVDAVGPDLGHQIHVRVEFLGRDTLESQLPDDDLGHPTRNALGTSAFACPCFRFFGADAGGVRVGWAAETAHLHWTAFWVSTTFHALWVVGMALKYWHAFWSAKSFQRNQEIETSFVS